jgi:hypothetical protein
VARRKGSVKTGGRVAGVPNKLNGDVRAMILAALDGAGGVDYLQEQVQKNPGPFMALVGKVLPTQLTGAGGGAIRIIIETGVPREPDTGATREPD